MPTILYLRNRCFSTVSPIDDLNKLTLPALAVGAEEVVSLEAMLSCRELAFDFDITSVKIEYSTKKGSGRIGLSASVLEKALLDYENMFFARGFDSKNTYLKLRFCLARLKLNTFLVERLLRDYLKRCKLHISLLSKLDESKMGESQVNESSVSVDLENLDEVYNSKVMKVNYYTKQSDSLLKEIEYFFEKKNQVFEYIDSAISFYRVDSKCELHSLEKEFYKLREKGSFKRLTGSLLKCMSELSGRRSMALPGSSSTISTMAAIGPISSYPYPYPWYESDWVLLASFSVIVLGAVYFLTKKDDDDDGSSGLTSGIKPSRGLLSPKKDPSAWDWLLDLCMNVRLMSRRLMSRRFAANRIGESTVRLRGSLFCVFPSYCVFT